jgi:hypothetical protein
MKNYIKQIADGRLTRGEVIERLKGWSKDSLKDFLDDMVADAIVVLMDGGNTPTNQVKSDRLSDMVDSIATELLPGYDKLRKPTQTASGRNQRNTDTGNEFRSCLLIQDDKKDELLKKLHLLIDTKKGKPVALVIRLCVELGLMNKPTFGVLQAEFGDIGHHSNYDKYYRNYPAAYEEHERQGMMSNLEPFKGYLDRLE